MEDIWKGFESSKLKIPIQRRSFIIHQGPYVSSWSAAGLTAGPFCQSSLEGCSITVAQCHPGRTCVAKRSENADVSGSNKSANPLSRGLSFLMSTIRKQEAKWQRHSASTINALCLAIVSADPTKHQLRDYEISRILFGVTD